MVEAFLTRIDDISFAAFGDRCRIRYLCFPSTFFGRSQLKSQPEIRVKPQMEMLGKAYCDRPPKMAKEDIMQRLRMSTLNHEKLPQMIIVMSQIQDGANNACGLV